VGSRLRADLQARGIAHLVVEEEAETVEALKTEGVEAFLGPCGEPAMLERLNLAGARYLISAIPDAFEAGHLVEAAKAANPGIWVVARAHSTEAVEYLTKVGADKVLMGEEELAKGMAAALG
jgi:CPA2 family monovalent cation:H+ antiporter-2